MNLLSSVDADLKTYQLFIELSQPVSITIGLLGRFTFPAGRYIYTGSAKRGLEARIRRHLSSKKKKHWHIDYLLAHKNTQITEVKRFSEPECLINQQISGDIIVPGFGASDCKKRCGSHLKYLHTL